MSAAFLSVIGVVKQAEAASSADEAEEQSPEDKFRRVLVPTIVRWAEESFIEDSKLIREMFRYVAIIVYLIRTKLCALLFIQGGWMTFD